MRSPVRTSANGPPIGCLRSNVQDDRTERCAAHAAIGYPHHVSDALRQQLGGDTDIAELGHARIAARSNPLQDEHGIGIDFESGAVDPSVQILDALEHHRRDRYAA